jgi:hypothetical protein
MIPQDTLHPKECQSLLDRAGAATMRERERERERDESLVREINRLFVIVL